MERRAVETEDAQRYAEEENLLFFETSAKTAENVNTVFEAIGRTIPSICRLLRNRELIFLLLIIAKKLPLEKPKPARANNVNLKAEQATTAEGCAC